MSVADHLNHNGVTARLPYNNFNRLMPSMSWPAADRILLHPLLKPEILEWDMSTLSDGSPERAKKLLEPATTPPVRSMTFMIPGFPFHLTPLEPAPASPAFITVVAVLHYLHSRLTVWKLGNAQYYALFGVQIDLAKAKCCLRNGVAPESQDDAYFEEHMRGVDLVPDGHYFGGLLHQRDANGANVWVVVLRNSPIATPSVHLPHVLAPGNLTWDIKDSPPAIRSAQHFNIACKPLEIRDISGHSVISIPPVKDGDNWMPFDASMALEAIHTAMNVKVHSDNWLFWDQRVAQTRKSESRKLSSAQKNREITYLGMMHENRQRFLGLWHNTTPSGDHYYTLLTQPSARPLLQLHGSLKRGVTTWSIFFNPNRSWSAWLDDPATIPRRAAMDVRIEFMPGSSWKLPIYRANSVPYITARHLLFCIYKFLALDELDISFNNLPLHLQNRIRKRAEIRRKAMLHPSAPTPPKIAHRMVEGPKEDPRIILSKEQVRTLRTKPPPCGFKRVDTLDKTMCTGLQHKFSLSGEDEWKVCFKD